MRQTERQRGRQRLSETEGQRREGLNTSKRQRAKALTMLPRLNETNSSLGDKEGTTVMRSLQVWWGNTINYNHHWVTCC